MTTAKSGTDEIYHRDAAAKAVEIYVGGMAPDPLAAEWRQVCRAVRKEILRTLIETKGLRDLQESLTKTGRHILVLRHLFAPPISQDQLKLIVKSYPKGAEKGSTRLSKQAADDFAAAFAARRDKNLTAWLSTNANPNRRQVKKLLDTLTPMISSQIFNTVRRNRLSDEQEKAVVALLETKGWVRSPSTTVNNTADLPPQHFMRKTRCKTRTATKEVDIACGVNPSLIMAMECKVSNDATNSVKRVSDVMDKTKAWNDQWGGFIQTAALLQGVVAYKDVARLLDSDVLVFWSHDLQPLADWLDARA
jgi:XamI restriction endonuclease